MLPLSVLSSLKKALIFPLTRNVPTTRVGSVDTWNIVDPGKSEIFVISAGVGKNVTFEIDLASRWKSHVLMLDPTPTGLDTVASLDLKEGLEYLPVGLAAKDGKASFAAPLRPEEGSYSITDDADAERIEFECLSLETLMKRHDRKSIDILKMDIEGFEYSILDQLLVSGALVRQICVEIHTRHGSGAPAGLLKAARLILRLYGAGYRIVFNKAMDFTFCHKSALPSSTVQG